VRSEGSAALPETHTLDSGGNTPIPRSPVGQPCRVLVVDDDDLVRGRLAALLVPSYDVETAASASEALGILDAKECHIVLTDWQMPDMDGLALCRKVRRRVQNDYIYVLMLTVRDTPRDILTGLAAGVDDYVVKGAPFEEILARLEIGRRITQSKHSSSPRAPCGSTDPATGAHNLHYLAQHLPRELARSERYGHSLAVLTCRIDGFERISDLESGDDVLRTFVGRSQGSIRKGDWLARTSSNEFMIVLPETTAQGARTAARKLRYLFTRDPLSTTDDSIRFTVRIDVTAIEAKHGSNGTLQINALLRAVINQPQSGRPFGANTLAVGNPVASDAIGANPGARNGIH
jgi:two-component system, cell cycle response regulator